MNEREIFTAARQMSNAAERDAFLDKACAGDLELRRRIVALLEEQAQLGSFLEHDNPPVRTLDQPITEAPGAVIGPYKLMEQIGEGGFGLVFVAEQHEPVRRKVALKILKPGMDTRHVVARFEAERQALAIMDHPNIAKVFDGGATPTGRPYFVMELVKGTPITQFCDENRSTPRQRLELFTDVCAAVQHAHQKGIIHRDLKPSNILVTSHDGKPVIKVIDFGVAKAIGGQLTEKTVYTQMAQLIGTPLYMSPEQAGQSGLDIDTRSDIYSLGVLLYELLTGTTPFAKERFKQAAYDEIRRIIREEEPPKPSTRLSDSKDSLPAISAQRQTEPAKLTKLVRGELDWIVMKALEKDRNRRYETASGLAMDVHRHLADEPVQACPPSAGYRIRKFVQRHKTALTMTSIVTLAFLLVVGGFGWMVRDRAAREEEQEREHVTREERLAREKFERQARVSDQIELTLREVERLRKKRKWSEALAAIRRAQAVLAGAEGDPATQDKVAAVARNLEFINELEELRQRSSEMLKGSEYATDDICRSYGKVFKNFGYEIETLSVADAAAQLRTRSVLAVPLAQALDDWSSWENRAKRNQMHRKLTTLAIAIDSDDWRSNLRRAILADKISAVVTLAESKDTAGQPADSQLLLARFLLACDKPELSLKVLERACETYPADFWIHFDLAFLCDRYIKPRPHEFVLRHLVAARALRPNSIFVWVNLGRDLWRQKKWEEAAACYHKAIALDPNFATGYIGLGDTLREQGRLHEALAKIRTAIEIDPSNAGAHYSLGELLLAQRKPDDSMSCFLTAIKLTPKYAAAHTSLGIALLRTGKLEAACASFREAIALDPENAKPHYNLAAALMYLGELDEAIAHCKKAILYDPMDGMGHYNYGAALANQGRWQEAGIKFRKAVEVEPTLVLALNGLGRAVKKQGNLDEAADWHRKAIAQDPTHSDSHRSLGDVLQEQGKSDDAIACYYKALEYAPKDPTVHCNLGYAYITQGKLEAAVDSLRTSIHISPKNIMAHLNLSAALSRQKKLDEAVTALREALKHFPEHPRIYANLGVILRECGKLQEALASHRKAVDLDPNNAQIRTNFRNALKQMFNDGVAQYRAGEFHAAIETLHQIRKWSGTDDAAVSFFLAMAHHKLDKKDEAQKWYDRAMTWTDEHSPKNVELRRIRTEAEKVLGIKKDSNK